jgi:hypothetical protein
VNEYNNRTGAGKKVNNSLILLLFGTVVCTCIDPFNPNIKGKESLLDVYPILTNENRSYTDNIYSHYTFEGYEFIEPVWDLRMNLQKLAFAKPLCSVCTFSGSITKPDFWVDLDLAK